MSGWDVTDSSAVIKLYPHLLKQIQLKVAVKAISCSLAFETYIKTEKSINTISQVSLSVNHKYLKELAIFPNVFWRHHCLQNVQLQNFCCGSDLRRKECAVVAK